MIRVIMGHKAKSGVDIGPILLKLRNQAAQYPGFVDAEDLLGEKDSSVVVTISTWKRAEDWKEWENSQIRKQLYQDVEEILEDKPRVQMYRTLETKRWV